MAESKKAPPEQTLKFSSGVRAKIWRNTAESGRTFFNVQLRRSYKDKNGNYHDSDSFGHEELLVVGFACLRAYGEVLRLIEAERLAANENSQPE